MDLISLPVELILEILLHLDGKAILAMKDVRLLFRAVDLELIPSEGVAMVMLHY
jgi:hypothetical protein